MAENNDEELEDQHDEEEGHSPRQDVAYIKFSPEDIDSIFEAVHNGIDILHTIMANVFENYQKKVVDYEVLKTEVDTKNEELKKHKDKLLEIYSEGALKQNKRKGKKQDEL